MATPDGRTGFCAANPGIIGIRQNKIRAVCWPVEQNPPMKRSSTISTLFLQVVIVLIGIGALALMLWEPTIEGRNAHATLFEIYFKDPFLAYAYVASIAFFAALYQAFRVLGYVR